MSIGFNFQTNTKVKFKVPGGSVGVNTTYYNFDRRFLVGLEYTINLQQRETTPLPNFDSAAIDAESSFSQLVYNHSIVGLRAGWLLNEQLFLVTGFGLEMLEQFDELRARNNSQLPEQFYQATGEKKNLFYLKYGLQYKRRYFVYDFFYSKRGIGLGVNYFFNG